jgi:tetratricopeptide (TPR) repeat protein
VKKPQWITLAVAFILVVILYVFGRIVPEKKINTAREPDVADNRVSTDSILSDAKKRLDAAQIVRLNALENSVVKGNAAEQKVKIYHQLAHFWADTGQIFEPYAWYEAEAARLENSEKSLTFAAHLFLQNMRGESDQPLKAWKALEAKDLFERSLKINPQNDSSIVGLGACYIFGGISASPMEGILKVRAVADKDSSNIFAQEVLGHGSIYSGQYDKAIARFETVYRLSNDNEETKLEACLMLAEAYERKEDRLSAVNWYKKSLSLIKNKEVKEEVAKRIDELSKG